MNSLGFLDEEVVANETEIESEIDNRPLDWNRLRDANDSYNTILFNSQREIVVRDSSTTTLLWQFTLFIKFKELNNYYYSLLFKYPKFPLTWLADYELDFMGGFQLHFVLILQ